MKKLYFILLLFTVYFSLSDKAVAQSADKPVGARIGVGTDLTLGIGFGIGASYTFFLGGTIIEGGADFFYHYSNQENTDEDSTYDYSEETELMIFAVRANYLYNYKPDEGGFFFIAGFGFVVSSIDWTKTGKDKSSGNEVEMNWNEGTSAGNIFNLGFGYAFDFGLDIRLEAPMLYFYNSYGAVAFAPTFTITAQYRFM